MGSCSVHKDGFVTPGKTPTGVPWGATVRHLWSNNNCKCQKHLNRPLSMQVAVPVLQAVSGCFRSIPFNQMVRPVCSSDHSNIVSCSTADTQTGSQIPSFCALCFPYLPISQPQWMSPLFRSPAQQHVI